MNPSMLNRMKSIKEGGKESEKEKMLPENDKESVLLLEPVSGCSFDPEKLVLPSSNGSGEPRKSTIVQVDTELVDDDSTKLLFQSLLDKFQNKSFSYSQAARRYRDNFFEKV